jgi:D-methionine transport system ATP-binding protein
LTAQLTLEKVGLSAPVGTGTILQDISFVVKAGEFVGLVGPSGAGKTALLRLLNRLWSPSSGEIYFQGRPLGEISAIALRRQVALVGQDVRLLGMTVAEALAYPLVLRGMPRREATAQVKPWLERCQIPTDWLHRTELELSGGQRQRVAIARALVTAPSILLLDEPTSAQDLGTATHLLQEIQDLTRHHQMTVLMSNHQLEWIEGYCQRLLYLKQGQLAGDWPIAAVDWHTLRQSILTANAEELAEWGDAEDPLPSSSP